MKIVIEKMWLVDKEESPIIGSWVMPHNLTGLTDEIFAILKRSGVDAIPGRWHINVNIEEDD